MYKSFVLIVLLVIGVESSFHAVDRRASPFQRLTSDVNPLKADLCKPCIEEVVSLVNTIANLILDDTILKTCSGICDALANKTSSQLLGDICKVGCDALGFDEFIKLINSSDLDPIYYCQLVKLCAINDNGDAKFIHFAVTPHSAPMGTEFVIDCSFKTVNGTGTGSFSITIVDPKNRSFGSVYLFEARKAGSYPERVGLITSIKPQCDSSEELCAAWIVGTYNVTAQVCNGLCGAHHPHTALYDSGATTFELTKPKF